ncbi:MAG: hypothetical protein P4M00_24675 [Azospirillaceae bacterium]|nr:hypothetical protein [Azospirillaceae bacterium]
MNSLADPPATVPSDHIPQRQHAEADDVDPGRAASGPIRPHATRFDAAGFDTAGQTPVPVADSHILEDREINDRQIPSPLPQRAMTACEKHRMIIYAPNPHRGASPSAIPTKTEAQWLRSGQTINH